MTERRLPAEAAIEIWGLRYVLTREVADMRIAAARKAGATDAECTEALATWEQMRADDVQHIHSQPTPAACKCSHPKSMHTTTRGDCWHTACGCSRFRNPAPRRPAGDGDIHEYLRQKGEIS